MQVASRFLFAGGRLRFRSHLADTRIVLPALGTCQSLSVIGVETAESERDRGYIFQLDIFGHAPRTSHITVSR